MMMRYGFQRLVLLGSAGYQRAELPLDDSVSLIAPNNTGKTSLINALQFLLIIDRRRMDFGAHSLDKSRRFYFPNNSACILLEATLPESGTVVLGCIGKGVSHDYEYFAYKGSLEVTDFRLPQGTQVAQPDLKSHLASKDKLVFSYTPSEFAELIYGGRRKRSEHEPDFTLFRLEHAADAGAFQRVLTRTLKLDKLTSAEVKAYLLQIFRRDLPDATIDFKQEWDKAFAEVNAQRVQYQAALAQQETLGRLEHLQQERLTLRGKLIVNRPLVEARLGEWQTFFQSTMDRYQADQHRLEKENRQLVQKDRALAVKQRDLQQSLEQLQAQTTLQTEMEQRFALVNDQKMLDARLKDARQRLEAQITLIGQTSGREPEAIEREQARHQQELEQLQRELASLSGNLFQQLARELKEDQVRRLNRVFSRQVMTLDPGSYSLESGELRRFLSKTADDQFDLPGLKIALDSLENQYTRQTEEEIRQRMREMENQLQSLARQREVAKALDAAQAKKISLEKEVSSIEQDIVDYRQLVQLQAESAQRHVSATTIEAELKEIGETLARSDQHAEMLRQQLTDLSLNISKLNNQHQEIERRRNQRGDDGEPFTWLTELDHHPWLADPGFSLEQLAERLALYQGDCRRLRELDHQLHTLVTELHTGGLTKYQYTGDEESEIRRMIDFSHHLPREAEALEKQARSAVVNVTASLRELRDGLLAFKSRMREFNRLINHRRLSDLKVFKIEPEDETQLVEAISLLISTAEQVESGDSFELFNHASVLDDDQLDRARQLLIDEGMARQGLKIADLFRLVFVIGKADGVAESFDDIDSAASNGTVLMAKLVTGLAMLHLMQDKRQTVQAVCYLDEALALDARNQKSLIDTAAEFGFALIFASPAPLTTARYCVPITHLEGKNHVSRKSWQVLEPLEAEPAPP